MTKAATLGGRYRLEEIIAEGGMGEVWRAHDELLGRAVAVKILRQQLASDPVIAERFRREARAAASLTHPNMANVFDYVEEDGRPGIVMELVEGSTLAQTISREAPMPPERCVEVLDQVLDALGAAHAAGVVHRDVKPGNVIIDPEGFVRVTDFGIARALGDSTLTDTGMILGSVHYVAPEQLEGTSPAPQTDLYAAGVVLYEMLTGKKPFDAETPVATAMSRLTNEPVPPSRYRPDLPPALEAVILRSLQRDPSARFEGAAAMRAALDASLNGGLPEVDGTAAMPAVTPDPTSTMILPAETNATTNVIGTAPPPSVPAEPLLASPRRLRLLSPLWIAIVLIILGLVLIGAFAVQSRNARVPKLTGLSLSQATSAATAAGFKVAVKRVVDTTHPKDFVKDQDPKDRTSLRRGATITLTVATEPECCKVPNLFGMTYVDAVAAATQAGLTLPPRDQVPSVPSDRPFGTVISQTPPANSTLSRDSQVKVTLSSGRAKRKGKGHEG